ncbi:hypothetical protein F4802DRAFT_451228 [Xylaria palmicola]|nr:hypothetical protein F4802DRAFT_451228 [Xylaria palmicola]
MPRKSHHRSRSSVDRVLDLLAELDENQMEALLREAESTVSGNIPVSTGIDLFGRLGPNPTPPHPSPLAPAPPPRRKFLTSLSPRKQTELRRRQSKRASTHQDPAAAGGAGHPEAPQNAKKTPRSYKRISRPVFCLPAPAATADLTELLAAYLLDASAALPSSPSSASTLSSPATPHSSFSPYTTQPEAEGPGFDLLEPSPPKALGSLDIFGGGPGRGLTRKISGIFEVLDDAGSPGPRR